MELRPPSLSKIAQAMFLHRGRDARRTPLDQEKPPICVVSGLTNGTGVPHPLGCPTLVGLLKGGWSLRILIASCGFTHSLRFASVRFGFSFGLVRFGSIRFGLVWFCSFRSWSGRDDSVRPGRARRCAVLFIFGLTSTRMKGTKGTYLAGGR